VLRGGQAEISQSINPFNPLWVCTCFRVRVSGKRPGAFVEERCPGRANVLSEDLQILGNDVWCGGGMSSTECALVSVSDADCSRIRHRDSAVARAINMI